MKMQFNINSELLPAHLLACKALGIPIWDVQVLGSGSCIVISFNHYQIKETHAYQLGQIMACYARDMKKTSKDYGLEFREQAGLWDDSEQQEPEDSGE